MTAVLNCLDARYRKPQASAAIQPRDATKTRMHMPVTAYPDVMEKLVSLAKRRGYIFQSSEIYGGTGSVWDYGPLGVELKNNIKRVWWRDFVQTRAEMVGIDASILMNPMVWKASGHLDHFTE